MPSPLSSRISKVAPDSGMSSVKSPGVPRSSTLAMTSGRVGGVGGELGSTDAEGFAEGSPDRAVDGAPDGGVDGSTDGPADGGVDGPTDGGVEGSTDGGVEGSTD